MTTEPDTINAVRRSDRSTREAHFTFTKVNASLPQGNFTFLPRQKHFTAKAPAFALWERKDFDGEFEP